MNLILVLAAAIGFLSLAAALLKILETGPTIGPAFSHAARLVIMFMVFLAICSAIEVLALRGVKPVAPSILIFVLGAFSVWRAWAPAWEKFFTRPPTWHIRPH